MKIEKINEKPDLLVLWTREDLEPLRSVSANLLRFRKAKNFFVIRMEQAQLEFGFEADNIPLMIEAIPVTTDSIIPHYHQSRDPEELDTRFSKFTPFKDQGQEIRFPLTGR